MKTNIQHTIPSVNVQVQVDELRLSGGDTKYYYYLGWGKDGALQSDALTYDELKAIHDLIGQAIKEYKPDSK